MFMSMQVYPFPQKFGVSDNFADHLIPNPSYPERTLEPGVDYLTPYKTPIFAVFKRTKIDKYINGYGTVYLVQIDEETGDRIDFIHAIVDKIHYTANAGDIVGYTDGVSDMPARSSGPHVLVTFRKNWENGGRTYSDIEPYFNNLPLKNNNSNNQNMNTDEFATVQSGEGLSQIAARMGIESPNDPNQWQNIANLNKTWQKASGEIWTNTSGGYEELNNKLDPGDKIRVRGVPSQSNPQQEPAAPNADDKIAQIKVEYEGKINELKAALEAKQTELTSSITNNIAKIEQFNKEIERLQGVNSDLVNKLAEHQQETESEFGIQLPAVDLAGLGVVIIRETVSANGLMAKWGLWVDNHFKSTTLQSILKYDMFVVIGMLLGMGGIATFFPTASAGLIVTAGLVQGIVYKLLLTKYDTNKDGILDISDTTELKKYSVAVAETKKTK